MTGRSSYAKRIIEENEYAEKQGYEVIRLSGMSENLFGNLFKGIEGVLGMLGYRCGSICWDGNAYFYNKKTKSAIYISRKKYYEDD